MNFVIFSSICPHLGCRFQWQTDTKKFFCPCHGSEFTIDGTKTAGPAPRGLDPLPFREKDGKAEITWIQYKSGTPDRIIVAYS
jgi:Rieske Fe-S protein